MRRLLVQVLFYSLAVAITVALLSLVSVPTAGPPRGRPTADASRSTSSAGRRSTSRSAPSSSTSWSGFVFLVGAERSSRSSLAAIFGRWYLRSPVAGLRARQRRDVLARRPGLRLLGLPLRGPRSGAASGCSSTRSSSVLVFFVLDSVFGLQRPHLDDAGQHRSLWSRLDRLPLSRRNVLVENIRMYEVWTTVTAYAQEIALGGTPLARFRGLVDRLSGSSSSRSLDKLSTPAKVRVMLQQLGPTYVKLGQMIERPPGAPAARLERGARQAPEHGPAVLVGGGRGPSSPTSWAAHRTSCSGRSTTSRWGRPRSRRSTGRR